MNLQTTRTTSNGHKDPSWNQQLFTKEDVFHLHKTLALLCLTSFFWRFSVLGSSQADLGFQSHPHLTWPTLVLHLCLNLSSLNFRIPAKRIASSGWRIWPEYRLHSAVFCLRHLACIALTVYAPQLQTTTPLWPNLVVVLSTICLADLASGNVQYPSQTIRDLSIPKSVRYWFSVTQFIGTSICLHGEIERCTIHFYAVFVVQLNPFVMTLQRKNLLTHGQSIGLYAAMLALGLTLVVAEFSSSHQDGSSATPPLASILLVAFTAAIWRMAPGLPRGLRSKYLIWPVLYCFLQTVIRPASSREVTQMAVASFAAVSANGVYHCHSATGQPHSKDMIISNRWLCPPGSSSAVLFVYLNGVGAWIYAAVCFASWNWFTQLFPIARTMGPEAQYWTTAVFFGWGAAELILAIESTHPSACQRYLQLNLFPILGITYAANQANGWDKYPWMVFSVVYYYFGFLSTDVGRKTNKVD